MMKMAVGNVRYNWHSNAPLSGVFASRVHYSPANGAFLFGVNQHMAKEILLTHGLVAIVDDEDFDALAQYRWHVGAGYHARGRGYAVRKEYLGGGRKDQKEKVILMHRQVMKSLHGEQIDHINGNPLDNRKANLRVCNNAENGRNRSKPKTNSSGYKGVQWRADCQKFVAKIECNGTQTYLGIFPTAEAAARAYDTKATELFGEFARLNFSDE